MLARRLKPSERLRFFFIARQADHWLRGLVGRFGSPSPPLESATPANLVPCGLNCMDFTFADENVVAAEKLSIDELVSGVSEK